MHTIAVASKTSANDLLYAVVAYNLLILLHGFAHVCSKTVPKNAN